MTWVKTMRDVITSRVLSTIWRLIASVLLYGDISTGEDRFIHNIQV